MLFRVAAVGASQKMGPFSKLANMYLYLVSVEDSPDRWIAIMSVLTAQVQIHVSESLR